MYVAAPVTVKITLSAAVGTMLPFASCTWATTKAASEPLEVHWKLVPSGLTTSGTTLRMILFSAPAVVRLSVAPETTFPLMSRHSAVTVPGAQLTIQCTWPGIRVVFWVRSELEFVFQGFGV